MAGSEPAQSPFGIGRWQVKKRGEAHAPIRAVGSSRPWQWDGRQAYRLVHGAIGTTDCRRGKTLGWRLLSQYRLYAQQERDFKREGRTARASRPALWHGDWFRHYRHGNSSSAQA